MPLWRHPTGAQRDASNSSNNSSSSSNNSSNLSRAPLLYSYNIWFRLWLQYTYTPTQVQENA